MGWFEVLIEIVVIGFGLGTEAGLSKVNDAVVVDVGGPELIDATAFFHAVVEDEEGSLEVLFF